MRPESSRKATTIVQIVDKPPQETKGDRKTLQILQLAAGKDKENLVGSGRSLRSTGGKGGVLPIKEIIDEKKAIINDFISQSNNQMQSNKRQKKTPYNIIKGKAKVKPEDLISNEEPSEKYWSIIAEKRRIALEQALDENKTLHEKIKLLEEENITSKQMLEETNRVIELLQEMVAENSSAENDDSDMSSTNDSNYSTDD